MKPICPLVYQELGADLKDLRSVLLAQISKMPAKIPNQYAGRLLRMLSELDKLRCELDSRSCREHPQVWDTVWFYGGDRK